MNTKGSKRMKARIPNIVDKKDIRDNLIQTPKGTFSIFLSTTSAL